MRLRVHLPEGTSEWESNVALFRVGRGDSCALRFEGQAAKYASWEHAEFSIGDDGGACVTDLGSSNGTYVDGVRIDNVTTLRGGSIVQIGSKGPRLEVLELAAPRHMPTPISLAAAPTVSTASNLPTNSATTRLQQRGLVLGLAVALLAVVGFLLARKSNSSPPQLRPAPSPVAQTLDPELHDIGEPQSSDPVQAALPVDSHDAPSPPPPAFTLPPATSPPPDAWSQAKELAASAYRLVVVEDPASQSSWPLAGAVIVGPQTLLTSADVGVELAKFLERGWLLKVVRDSQDLGVKVDRVRVHAVFQEAAPEQQLYFDLALISAAERLDGAAALASAAELAEIERGQPLGCIAIDHAGEAIDRFQQLQPEWRLGKTFALTALSAEAGAPRLLHLRGAFSDKSSGSPIFNNRGQLVAIYCEAAPDRDEAHLDRAIHYAKLIEPQLIEQGLAEQESRFWVTPVLPPLQSAKEVSAQ